MQHAADEHNIRFDLVVDDVIPFDDTPYTGADVTERFPNQWLTSQHFKPFHNPIRQTIGRLSIPLRDLGPNLVHVRLSSRLDDHAAHDGPRSLASRSRPRVLIDSANA